MFRHWLVKAVSSDKPAVVGASVAQPQQAAAAASAEASAVQEYPWAGEDDEELLGEDAAMEEAAPQVPVLDSDAAASAFQQLEEKAVSYVALPSGLTPWWVKFLLRQGVTEATQWAKVMGVGSEIELPTDLQA